MAKPKIATTSLAGCFGCHMSLLDIDERILDLVEIIDFDKSPIDDIKHFTGRCRIGLMGLRLMSCRSGGKGSEDISGFEAGVSRVSGGAGSRT